MQRFNSFEFATKYPTLTSLLLTGVVRLDGSEYVGRASDGIEVRLGHVTMPESTEAYLKAYPTPKDW